MNNFHKNTTQKITFALGKEAIFYDYGKKTKRRIRRQADRSVQKEGYYFWSALGVQGP